MKVVVVVEAEGVVRNSPRNNQIHQYIEILEHLSNLRLISMCTTTPIRYKRKGYRYQISPYMHTPPQFPCIVGEVAMVVKVEEEEMVVVVVVAILLNNRQNNHLQEVMRMLNRVCLNIS